VVVEATLMAIYSEPRLWFSNAFGGEQRRLALVFLVNERSGTLLTATDETTDARFFDLDHLPEIDDLHRETRDDLRQFTGEVILKQSVFARDEQGAMLVRLNAAFCAVRADDSVHLRPVTFDGEVFWHRNSL
jgi:hypothetical protein